MAENHASRRAGILMMVAGALLILLAALFVHYSRPISIRGSVMRMDADSRRQSPIADVEVRVVDGVTSPPSKSDFSGYFKLILPRRILAGHAITLQFRHPDYLPLDVHETVSDKIYLVHMTPVAPDPPESPAHSEIPVTNVLVRYSIETSSRQNIGTGIKTFQIANVGNVPCKGTPPCSPDGMWKAATGGVSLNAGEGNEYENARVSCIAGPCPFTRIASDGFSHGGRTISVSVLDWSDTTTFLLQAEVFRNEISDSVRESYPVIFGDSLNFTLPAAAQGQSLEAEVSGTNIIFPLGPAPVLSWSRCSVRLGKDQSKVYRCELKPGYRFR